MTVLIDNYDSFTYNLYQYLAYLGESVTVYRNDKTTVAELQEMRPARIVISPGPGRPADAGISCDLIGAMAGRVPILGVCLGHQAIGEVFGATVDRAGRLMHGKTSPIHHDGQGLFAGLPNPFEAVRYHSLIVQPATVPDCLEVSARTDQDEIMGLRHRELTIEGVQFHPESVMTAPGLDLLSNFLKMTEATRPAQTEG
jgi:anthranilate synthase component 2